MLLRAKLKGGTFLFCESLKVMNSYSTNVSRDGVVLIHLHFDLPMAEEPTGAVDDKVRDV